MTSTSIHRPVGAGGLAGQVTAWARSHPDDTACTFVDYTETPRGAAESVSWAALDRRVGSVAAWLAERTEPGDRVAVLAPQGIGYVVAFLAAQRAGTIAVPLFPPDLPGHADRLAATLTDCTPAAILTTTRHLDQVTAFTGAPRIGDVDTLPDREPPEARPEPVAYLQYTSGSTRAPAGVVISHANVLANARQALTGYGVTEGDGTTPVSWLPLFHDMGLVLGIAAPVVARLRSVLMDPVAFLEKPVRWLKLLSGHPLAVSAAPNFAYGYAASRVTEPDLAWLRLDEVKALINGAEPLWPATLDKFQSMFGACGLRPETMRPSYGLAEATVLVTVSPRDTPPRATSFDRDALAEGRAVAPAGATSTLVACGTPVDQEIRIVDPDSGAVKPDGLVGEVWVSGPNVAGGYWNNPEATARTFGAALDGRDWLRTGDLGVIHEGELYVTGRLRDLIIVGGRNHYPQDIEQTVEQAHPAVRAHHVVAFSVPVDEQDALVVLAERARQTDSGQDQLDEVDAAVRQAVSARHAVAVHAFRLLDPGQVPRTSSGKVARQAARVAYLAGRLG